MKRFFIFFDTRAMMHYNIKNTIGIFILFLCMISIAYAMPSDYSGVATIAGTAVSTDTEITVFSADTQLASTATPTTDVGQLNYGYHFYILAFETTEGAALSFRICGIEAQTATFAGGSSNPSTNLNIAKQADGTRSCTCDDVCTGGHCVNPTNGVCSAETYYCDQDGTCESTYGENSGNCRADCPSSTSGGGGAAPSGQVKQTLTESTKVGTEGTLVVIKDDFPESVITLPEGIENTSIDFSALFSESKITLDNSITIVKETEGFDLTIEIPANTIISGPEGWDGTMTLPSIRQTTSVSVPVKEGQEAEVSSVIEVGFEDETLVFSNAVRMVFEGQAGKLVGYESKGAFTEITSTCSADSQEAGNSLPAEGDCKITVGDDVIVWTKHFTKFVTYDYLESSEPVIPESEPATEVDIEATNDTQIETPTQQPEDTTEGMSGITGKTIAGGFDGFKSSFLWFLLIIVIVVVSIKVYRSSTNNVMHLHTKAQMLHRMAEKYHLSGETVKSQQFHAKANVLQVKAMRLKRRR